MCKVLLISSTANFNNNLFFKSEVIETLESVKEFGNNFNSVTFIETINPIIDNPIESFGYRYIVSSVFNNFELPKGYNQFTHILNVIKDNFYGENDVLVFLTGRYCMVNDEIFNLINDYMSQNNFDLIAKDSSDIYDNNLGVHTFYFLCRKKEFIKFMEHYYTLNPPHGAIEVDVKNYMLNKNNCLILPPTHIMGVRTNISATKLRVIC